MHDFKIAFPKLRVKSTLHIAQKSQTIAINGISLTDVTQLTKKVRPSQQKLQTLKYQYINKSPHYFKIKNRSTESLTTKTKAEQSIEEYLGEHSRILDKEMLMQLARKRMKTIRNQPSSQAILHPQDPSLQKSPFSSREQNSSFKLEQAMKQSKYQHFRPTRVPLQHSIKYIIHPDLRVIGNLLMI